MTALERALRADSSQAAALVYFMPLYSAEEAVQRALSDCERPAQRARLEHAAAALASSQMLLCKVWQACSQADAMNAD